jgi:hypothetical protein
MVTRRARLHHGFLTRFHRPVNGGHRRHHHGLPARAHPVRRIRSAHAAHLVTHRAKKSTAVRRTKAHTSRTRLSHTKIAGGHKVSTAHRRPGIHAAGHKTATHHGTHRTVSAATRAKISHSLTGKHHPHRGHAMSAATRAKIAAALRARLKGRPHPHKGHHMSNAARQKVSRKLTGRHNTSHRHHGWKPRKKK